MSEPVSAGLMLGAGLIGGLKGLTGGNKAAKAAAQQYQYNLALQQQAQKWNEYMYKNRYQMQVEDLEKAGINKLYGIGNANTPTSGITSVGMPEYTQQENNRLTNALNGVQTLNNISAQRAQIEKIKQETKTEKINTLLYELETTNKELDILQKKKNYNWTDKLNESTLNERKSQIIKNLAESNESYERAGNARAQKDKLNAEREEIDRINQFHREHPRLSKIITGSKELQAFSKILNETAGTGLKFWEIQKYNNVKSAEKNKKKKKK